MDEETKQVHITEEESPEEYRLEDGRARVFVTGRRTDGNSICYERIQVTG